MIPTVTKEDHQKALRDNTDCIGYCKNLFYDKTNSNLPSGVFFSNLTLWLNSMSLQETVATRKMVQYSLLSGSEKIKKYYSQKFA